MAKFIPILGQLSGTIAGLVFSRNRNGAYVRGRVLPVNPLTNFQTNIRGIFGNFANSWAFRTDTQKSKWRAYADTMPLVDSLGQTYKISGFNAFVRGNAFRVYNLLLPIFSGPIQGGQAAAIAPQPASIVLADGASTVPNTIQLNVPALVGFDRSTDDTVLSISLGPILPAGVLFFSTPFQVKGQVFGDAGTPPTQETVPAGINLIVGQRLAVRLRWADDEARVSPIYQEIVTVTNVV